MRRSGWERAQEVLCLFFKDANRLYEMFISADSIFPIFLRCVEENKSFVPAYFAACENWDENFFSMYQQRIVYSSSLRAMS
jgi:hypothetical protein